MISREFCDNYEGLERCSVTDMSDYRKALEVKSKIKSKYNKKDFVAAALLVPGVPVIEWKNGKLYFIVPLYYDWLDYLDAIGINNSTELLNHYGLCIDMITYLDRTGLFKDLYKRVQNRVGSNISSLVKVNIGNGLDCTAVCTVVSRSNMVKLNSHGYSRDEIEAILNVVIECLANGETIIAGELTYNIMKEREK